MLYIEKYLKLTESHNNQEGIGNYMTLNLIIMYYINTIYKNSIYCKIIGW